MKKRVDQSCRGSFDFALRCRHRIEFRGCVMVTFELHVGCGASTFVWGGSCLDVLGDSANCSFCQQDRVAGPVVRMLTGSHLRGWPWWGNSLLVVVF